MEDEITSRLIELRMHIDSVETEAIRHDFDQLNATLEELMSMHDELFSIYQDERGRYVDRDTLTGDEEDEMNAVEETLEAAQTTTLLVIDELREKYPDQPDRPEIIEFEEMVEQMRGEMDEVAHHIRE